MHNFVSGCSEGMNSTFANHFQTKHQCVQKLLFTCVVYTNELYLNYFHKTLQEFIWLVHEVDYHLLIWRLQIIKTNNSPPSLCTHKRKKNCMLWFSVECHGFKFLKFHSVTDHDIMTTKNKKQHCLCYYSFATLSDQDIISPYNINTIPSRQATRLKKNIK